MVVSDFDFALPRYSMKSGRIEGRLPATIPTQGSIIDHMATSLVSLVRLKAENISNVDINTRTLSDIESPVIFPHLEYKVLELSSPPRP